MFLLKQYIYVVDLRGAEKNEVLSTIKILNPFHVEMDDKIGIFQGRELIIATKTSFVHLDVGRLIEEASTPDEGDWTLDVKEEDFVESQFSEVNVKVIFPTSDLKGLTFSPQNELKEMLDIGENKIALVFENQEN